MQEKRLKEAGSIRTIRCSPARWNCGHEIAGFPRHLSQHVGGFILTAAARRDGAHRQCGDGGPHLHRMGQGRHRRAGHDQGRCAGAGHAHLHPQELRADRGLDGPDYTLATVPREDEAVYDMLCKADSVGVFQVESRAQMNMLPRLKPRCFYDLVIEVAIVRPGPIQGDMVHPYLRRRDGLSPRIIPRPHPDFGPPTNCAGAGPTKGVPLFQEQAMKLAMVAAEFTPGELPTSLRKAMATFRRRGTIGRLEEKMVSAWWSAAMTRIRARCFNQIKGFGEYGFPESHAASFAIWSMSRPGSSAIIRRCSPARC
jgi:error-prone DNA polymerase